MFKSGNTTVPTQEGQMNIMNNVMYFTVLLNDYQFISEAKDYNFSAT